MGSLNSLTVRAKWKAGSNVQIPASSWRRSMLPRLFVLSKTTNQSVRATDHRTGKVEPLVAGEIDQATAMMKLKALYPDCEIMVNY